MREDKGRNTEGGNLAKMCDRDLAIINVFVRSVHFI